MLRQYTNNDEPFYTIHEFYYDNDNSIMGYVEKEDGPFGDNLDELKQTLQWMLAACDRPPLDIKELDAYFEAEREKHKDDPEEEYERFDSVEELLASLETWENEDEDE